MLRRVALLSVRRRRLILVAAVLGFAVAGGLGGGVAEHLSSGGFDDPSSESSRAEDVLEDRFGAGTPNVVLLVTADDGSVDDPGVAAAGRQLTQELSQEPGVVQAGSYWTLGSAPPLRSRDGDRALVVARIEGSQDDISDRAEELKERFVGPIDGATVEMGGFAAVFNEIGTTIEEDLVRAELIALPLTLILLLLVFRSVVAATLPLAIGALSVVATFLVLRVLAGFTEVSVFALNLTTAMGLGLAIDYSLFVVSRFREELAAGHPPHEAVIRTVRTAGRTVAFSALTVAASLCALLVFPLTFLRSFAYAGVAVAALAGLCAVVVLPAVLAVLGHRVDALALPRRRTVRPTGAGVWHRVATAVMRRPVPIATVVIIVLLLLGSPFLRLELGRPDDRVLPASADSRRVSDLLRSEFDSQEAGALSVVAAASASAGTGTELDGAVDAYAARLSELPGVDRVDARTGVYLDGSRLPVDAALTERFAGRAGTWLSVVPTVEPNSGEGERLVDRIRDLPAPFPVEVTGMSAQLTDGKASLFARIPVAIAIIAVVTFALLFLMFGSVVVPLKALVLNLLSLTATFGAMVWVFQDGNLASALDFSPTGTLDATTPILMFCVAFGLSMDYEVFLLSRIKEEHDLGRDNVSSVAMGLERTGRIVTAAAGLIAVVFLAFATSRVTFIKLFGVGLTLAVLMDAFLIRGTLVPAFMRLAGDANWWAPRWLRRIHDRAGLSEVVDLDGPTPGDGPVGDATAGGPGNGDRDSDPEGERAPAAVS